MNSSFSIISVVPRRGARVVANSNTRANANHDRMWLDSRCFEAKQLFGSAWVCHFITGTCAIGRWESESVADFNTRLPSCATEWRCLLRLLRISQKLAELAIQRANSARFLSLKPCTVRGIGDGRPYDLTLCSHHLRAIWDVWDIRDVRNDDLPLTVKAENPRHTAQLIHADAAHTAYAIAGAD